MSQPDIEKKKGKKRRRSARVYISNAHPLPSPEELAALVDQFPSDEDDDAPTPAHTEARARTRAMARPDTGKRDSQPGGRSAPDPRVSPSRVAGNAATAVDDHGGRVDPMNVPGPKALALGHPDMRQGATRPVPLLSMRTDADMFPRDLSGMSIGIPVALARLDAAAATGLASAPGNPASRRMDHIAPTSALPANGGHGLADPQSHAVALKASDRVEAVRQAMFGDRAR